MTTAAASGALARARRAIATASALWRDGLVPEAHADMASALRSALEPWAAASGDPSPGDGDDSASAHEARAFTALARAGYRDVDRLRAALAAPNAAATGASAASIAPVAPAEFEQLWAEAERLYRFGARRLATPLEQKQRRVRRAIAGALAVAGVLLLVGRLWLRPHVSASALFSPEFPASYAADRIESTEWLLPDRTPGWFQISFPWSRTVHGVRVVNGHNKWILDRAAEQIRVTAHSKNGTVASVEGRFAKLTEERSALDLKLDARQVKDVRVEVLSYFGLGGTLAEVEVY